jgi:DNA-directed RNA polymerase subunit RPC12/RpoP
MRCKQCQAEVSDKLLEGREWYKCGRCGARNYTPLHLQNTKTELKKRLSGLRKDNKTIIATGSYSAKREVAKPRIGESSGMSSQMPTKEQKVKVVMPKAASEYPERIDEQICKNCGKGLDLHDALGMCNFGRAFNSKRFEPAERQNKKEDAAFSPEKRLPRKEG